MKSKVLKTILAFAMVAGAQTYLYAQGTAFTYQGRLNTGGTLANGAYDIQFAVFDAVTNGIQTSVVLTNPAVAVSNGLFTTAVDFGASVFRGAASWLELAVRTNGIGTFTTLTPRQQLTPTPYAMYANTASNLSGSVASAQIAGTIQNSSLPASPFFQGSVGANAFFGNGGGVTNVNAATLNGLSSANFWKTAGNAGTSPTNGNFLGTTDNQPLEIRANNSRALRLEPDAAGNGSPNVIGGSPANVVAAGVSGATISGGGTTNGSSYVYRTNFVAAHFSTIGGGRGNSIQAGATESVIGGGAGNTIKSSTGDSTISGGFNNQIQANANNAFIGGGSQNQILGGAVGATIGGGNANLAGGIGATVGGGGLDNYYTTPNNASGNGSTIAGGVGNTVQATAADSVVGGGVFNFIGSNAVNSVIGGGYANLISGAYATVPGGYGNQATAPSSFAAGNNAIAAHQGAFVWADSQSPTFTSTGNDQFLIRAQGGVGINTNDPAGAALSVNGKITSTQWKASTTVNANGPLPRSGNIITGGGTLLIFISGSGYSTSAGALIGMDLKIDGNAYTSATIYANPSLTHMAFVPNMVIRAGLSAGSHTLSLAARSGTATDASDGFVVTVQELPF